MIKMNSISGISCNVKDIAETAKFYETLGFRFGKQSDDYLICYVNWFWIEFRLFDGKNEGPSTSSGSSVAISVADVDEFYNELIDKGLTPLTEPVDQKWGRREFEIIDPDGLRLMFFKK